jgi:hypothetical protein
MEERETVASCPLLDNDHENTLSHTTQREKTILPWLLVAVLAFFSAALLLALAFGKHSSGYGDSHYGELCKIKLLHVRPLRVCLHGMDVPIPIIHRRFTGGLKYDENGDLYRHSLGEEISYVGNSSGVNKAWDLFDASESRR